MQRRESQEAKRSPASLRQDVAQRMEERLLTSVPTLLCLRGPWQLEWPDVPSYIHEHTPSLHTETFRTIRAKELLNKLSKTSERMQGTTAIVDYHKQPPPHRMKLLRLLRDHAPATQQGQYILLDQSTRLEAKEQQLQEQIFAEIWPLPPLYQRHADIEPLLSRLFAKKLKHVGNVDVQGLSLEALAHIHRAVSQTHQDGLAVSRLLDLLLEKAQSPGFPKYEGYIVAWPVVRLLEEQWSYQIRRRPDEADLLLRQSDMHAQLFSASMQEAAQRSGLSRELLELHSKLMLRLLQELPEHQRNYQGLTSHLDQLTWTSMKLLSGARTQAELRDFFGFGGTGKIPKATVKLKFDQYQLDQYGFRSCDASVWTPLHSKQKQDTPPAPATPLPFSAETNTQVYAVEDELDRTLFWNHQDLFTMLASSPMSLAQIAALTDEEPESLQATLAHLEERGLLAHQDGRYHAASDKYYLQHSNSPLRFLEENLVHYLNAAFQSGAKAMLENCFLRLPEEGLPYLRAQELDPFIHEQFLPLSDQDPTPPEDRQMYAMLLLGTDRLHSHIHGRTPPQERIIHYFREASLQRVTPCERHRAICLQVTQMLSPTQAAQGLSAMQGLRKRLKPFAPHGRGSKPNFNLTLCLTPVPLRFSREKK